MSKFKKIVKIIGIVLLVLFLGFGIPIIINEYLVKWDASALLGYYGTILGSTITIIIFSATICFTKNQIKREGFLKTESEKLYKLKFVFLEVLKNINPIIILKDVMDSGFVNPTTAINILQRFQMDCKTSTDLLNAHLNINDYHKVKHLIDKIVEMSEEFVNISSEEIKQYSDFRILQNKDSFYKIMNIEKENPGTFSKENLEMSQEAIKKLENINIEEINSKTKHLNSKFIRVYESKYRNLLQDIGKTFEELEYKMMYDADALLNFKKNNNDVFSNKKKQKKC